MNIYQHTVLLEYKLMVFDTFYDIIHNALKSLFTMVIKKMWHAAESTRW